MFERFKTAYGPSREVPSAHPAPWLPDRAQGVTGFQEFTAEFAGASFDGGLYRIHDEHTGAGAAASIAEAFPEFATRVCPFAYDWLGNQFALDAARVVDGQPQVLLLEPGTGEALQIPASFLTFHEDELVDDPDACLAVEFFREWRSANADHLPLRSDECVGYRVPLFLGGQDVVANLELTDVEVYWSISGQMRVHALSLPLGAAITEVSVSERRTAPDDETHLDDDQRSSR